MAKKKKTAQAVTTTPVNIGYSGKVTVQLRNGNKTIKKTTYKNSGGPALFKFIAMCLCGSYGTAAKLCPSKIALYTNNASSPEGATYSATTTASQLVSNDATPTMVKNADNSYSVTYHFTVPYSKILTSDDLKINEFILFNSSTTQAANVSEYCAYYYLTKQDPDDKTKKAWDPIVPGDYSTNFNIILDWEMTISNQSTSTVNS